MRKANADKVAEVLQDMRENPWEHRPMDRETFEKELRGFMMLTEHPFIMGKDEAFARNLKRNYELCETAWRMKKWVSDAVEAGYFPESYDLSEVEAKIARYEELKEYLDIQSELMQNPYYQYMAKKDFFYRSYQIEKMKNETKNEDLRAYLTAVQKLKALSFVRRKGMDSVEEKTLAEGKRRAEILRERTRKRRLVKTFSDEALELKGEPRLRDKNYDATFTEEAFREALDSFKKIDLKDLHFKDIRDIADHFKSNVRLFEEVRKFDRLLFIAAQKNLHPNDDEMMRLRAKLRVFKNAEYMMYEIQRGMLENPEAFINEKTTWEFLEGRRDKIKDSMLQEVGHDILLPGQNLSSYYCSVLKAVKKEHSNRKKAIRIAYERVPSYEESTYHGPG